MKILAGLILTVALLGCTAEQKQQTKEFGQDFIAGAAEGGQAAVLADPTPFASLNDIITYAMAALGAGLAAGFAGMKLGQMRPKTPASPPANDPNA